MYPDFTWIMYGDKSLMQRKAKISPFQSSVTKTYFSLGDLSAFFKVTYSGQKLNYKDHISSAHLQLPGAWLFGRQPGYASCPAPALSQHNCMQQQQAVDTHPPVHKGTARSFLLTTLASLTHKLWQMRKHSPMQYPTVGESPLPSMQC